VTIFFKQNLVLRIYGQDSFNKMFEAVVKKRMRRCLRNSRSFLWHNQFHYGFLICSYIDCDIGNIFILYCSGCRRCILKISFLNGHKNLSYSDTQIIKMYNMITCNQAPQLCTSVKKRIRNANTICTCKYIAENKI